METLAWGRPVTPAFRQRVRLLAASMLYPDPLDVMTCMAFEAGRTFSPSVRNVASGATGLIQFSAQTAALLGTLIEALAKMSAEGPRDYVARYFAPWKGRLKNLGDLYLTILWPADVGKSDDTVLFHKSGPQPKLYLQDRGIDLNFDGDITRGEVVAKIRAMRVEGMLPATAA